MIVYLFNVHINFFKHFCTFYFYSHKLFGYQHSSKSLILCSTEEEKNSYKFGLSWGQIHDDRIFIFGWTIPLKSQQNRSSDRSFLLYCDVHPSINFKFFLTSADVGDAAGNIIEWCAYITILAFSMTKLVLKIGIRPKQLPCVISRTCAIQYTRWSKYTLFWNFHLFIRIWYSVCVCVCVCVCVHVYVVYEDTNLYNNMGMT